MAKDKNGKLVELGDVVLINVFESTWYAPKLMPGVVTGINQYHEDAADIIFTIKILSEGPLSTRTRRFNGIERIVPDPETTMLLLKYA